jgi:hypothetical protein
LIIRAGARSLLRALPFAIMAAVGCAWLTVGPAWAVLPLLAVGPAVASAVGGALLTVAAGGAGLAICLAIALSMPPGAAAHHVLAVAFLAVACATGAGIAGSRARARRDSELAAARLVADAAERVLLRPVPPMAGPVRLAGRYLSASSGAHVGGDFYEVIPTAAGVRLVLGDVEGKGLPAVRAAAVVLGAFREAAYEEESLPGIAARIEVSLARQFSEEQFATAVLAEIGADGTTIGLLSCGHPPPLLLGQDAPAFVDTGEPGLPLGLGALTSEPRIPVTIPFAPGGQILFYTDGASEARNKAGEYFPLHAWAAISGPADPGTLTDRLSDDLIRYIGHAAHDDVALLLVYRDSHAEVAAPRPARDQRQAAVSLGRPRITVTSPRSPVSRRSPQRSPG